MTQYPEAALAREAGLAYVGIGLITDYDSGLDDDPAVEPVTQEQVFAAFEANVARLRERFGDRVAGFYHIKDPLEPPLVPGKSAAMNWGGRDMFARLTAEGRVRLGRGRAGLRRCRQDRRHVGPEWRLFL